MNEDRTWLATVLFLDIVSYSTIPVNQQLKVKRHFQQMVSSQINQLEEENTIRLDTGDGMAICYLGDPERMYPVGRKLRDIFSSLDADGEFSYQVRLGLNLGPVKIIEDLNHGRNCIGSGINDAERVMSFAAPNQLLVSRSYFEIVSQLSQDYSNELHHLGLRADKHDHQHDIYELSVEVVRVDDFPHVTSQPAGPESVPPQQPHHFDPKIIQRISDEFIRYVGKSEAEKIMHESLAGGTSIAELCAMLTAKLSSEDDRYSFNEFLKYYGYSGY